MANLAIKGHATRGEEVIEILEMLGGKNTFLHYGDNSRSVYYIDKSNRDYISRSYTKEDCDCVIFTLEEFLEKYPYKIGDKVNSPCKGCIKQITSMEWDTYLNTVTYKLDNKIYTNIDQLKVVNDLQPCKEETMDRKYNVEEYLKVWKETEKGLEVVVNDRFELKEDNGKFYIIKKQPQYQKTYVECAKILDCFGAAHIDGYKGELLDKLQELLICRDAYWKIAGDWKPDFMYCDLYCIGYDGNVITWKMQGGHRLLAFPTAEIRDVFYENFKELIEECKEFL